MDALAGACKPGHDKSAGDPGGSGMESDLVGGHADLQGDEALAIVTHRLADGVRSFTGAGPFGKDATAVAEPAKRWIATTGQVAA